MKTTVAVMGAVGWLVLTFGAAVLGSRFPPDAWYYQLNKPSWNPPGWVFAPVWTLLYAMMAVSAWLVWKRYGFTGAAVALSLFVLQLILNAAWTWLFFGLHRPDLAFVDIILLWAGILATLVAFWKLLPVAGSLLIPYLAWVSFAAFLNWTLWRMNS
jgi:translocator protein